VNPPPATPSRWAHWQCAIIAWWRGLEPWQRWAILIALGIALALGLERWQRWTLVPKDKNQRQKTWEREGTVRIDANGDGFIDEERRPGKVPGEFIIKKDANFDGYFDLRYRQTTNGFAVDLEKIHESVPRQ
jgi:hypothetical protein